MLLAHALQNVTVQLNWINWISLDLQVRGWANLATQYQTPYSIHGSSDCLNEIQLHHHKEPSNQYLEMEDRPDIVAL